MKKKMKTFHFGSFLFGGLVLTCGGKPSKLKNDYWTQRPEDVTCRKCYALLLTNSGKRMVEKKKKKLVRKVHCLLCQKKMFYNGDPKWEPEFSLDISLNHKLVEGHYVHQKCWNGFKASKPKKARGLKMFRNTL